MESADRINVGGVMLTLEDARPLAEALATCEGHVVAVGSRADVFRHGGAGTEVVDLAGRALLPGVGEPHAHVVGGELQGSSAKQLAPPVGTSPTLRRCSLCCDSGVPTMPKPSAGWA